MKKKDVTSVGQQVGGQQAGEAWVKQPGAFLDPSTRTALRRTAWTRAGGGDGGRGRERERSMTQNLNHRNYRLIHNKHSSFINEARPVFLFIKFLIDWETGLMSDWSPGVSRKETNHSWLYRDTSEYRAQQELKTDGARYHRCVRLM